MTAALQGWWRRIGCGDPEGRFLWATGTLVAAAAGLLLLYDLERFPALFYGLVGLGFVALFVAVGAARSVPLSRFHLLAVAALLRLLLLPLPPSLSNDVYRYLWDGRVVAAGFNPYVVKPAAAELEALRDETYDQMSHRTVETVYPPLAMVLFSISSRLHSSLLAYKTILTGIDLVACALLLTLASRLGVGCSRALWYAWNPLAVLEVAGMGHIDALGVAAMIVTLWLLLRHHPESVGRLEPESPSTAGAGGLVAGAAAAAGVLAKLAPVLCLPMWARQSGRPLRFLGCALLLLAVALLPVVWSTGGVPPGLVTYAVSWEYNGPLYEPLWRLLYLTRADQLVQRGLGIVEALPGLDGRLERLKSYAYPQVLAKGLLGLVLLGLVVRSAGEREIVAGTRRLLGGALLLQATIYPWYLLWVLPAAALTASSAWLVLSATLSFAYLPSLVGVGYFPWVYPLIWAPPLLTLIATRLHRRRCG